MTERNPCSDAGCLASCCYGPWFSLSYTEKEIKRYFPMAKKVSDSQFREIQEPGVYYTSFLRIGSIRIVGKCPYLNGKNECANYENRPPDCSRLGISSDSCVEFRRSAVNIPVEVGVIK